MEIKIEKLTFKFNNSKKNLLDNLDLKINQGEIIAVLGNSGSGKSTLLRIISGLETALSGSMIIDNKIIFDDKTFIEPEKREVGMLFQDYALFPHMSVEKNISYGLKSKSKVDKQIIIDKILDLVELKEYKKRYPHELSGGQQQRIAMARALAPSPKLLLLDEPFSNLDATLKSKIRKELKTILNKANITTIIVTHDVEDALALTNSIYILEDGKLINYVRN